MNIDSIKMALDRFVRAAGDKIQHLEQQVQQLRKPADKVDCGHKCQQQYVVLQTRLTKMQQLFQNTINKFSMHQVNRYLVYRAKETQRLDILESRQQMKDSRFQLFQNTIRKLDDNIIKFYKFFDSQYLSLSEKVQQLLQNKFYLHEKIAKILKSNQEESAEHTKAVDQLSKKIQAVQQKYEHITKYHKEAVQQQTYKLDYLISQQSPLLKSRRQQLKHIQQKMQALSTSLNLTKQSHTHCYESLNKKQWQLQEGLLQLCQILKITHPLHQ